MTYISIRVFFNVENHTYSHGSIYTRLSDSVVLSHELSFEDAVKEARKIRKALGKPFKREVWDMESLYNGKYHVVAYSIDGLL